MKQVDAYTDAHRVMRASNSSFSSNAKLKSVLITSVFDCNLQMSISLIDIPEKHFDFLNFPMDKDFLGREWTLTDDKAIIFR